MYDPIGKAPVKVTVREPFRLSPLPLLNWIMYSEKPAVLFTVMPRVGKRVLPDPG
jgi:hypothetical protein